MPFFEPRFKQNKNEITAILINKVMRKEQTKRGYSAPRCMIIQVNETTNLMDTSYPGQHNPAQPGGTFGDAKQAPGWLSEEEEEDGNPAWED